ncbi:peptide ABC transporter ATP-binding protein [Malaciobacter molluscorum LMG 25693]|uniref:ABC transporter, ATP-binding protein n=1 Tax=Malaciobacter molluscorum LMG 25693 TaxID=870501 RepID=A0A2G1DJD4_9BACT|nr:ATP-binding cassette domain-containing protein [Malaciobacter molluscorum]AXX91586.1 ABC transporter, ATP-binding protein [Malaciobacter molluscorum LMG 25693]PHO18617.1 peptide ABC transporter ATP-binding protein [Malaciobacter molluscorum LMG 25693]RXJ94552.1 peptide ABC transporter ATP-binding protein [Malaciobacter molluscorum]
MNNDVVLSIKNLTFAYDKNKPIFQDFNLELKKGELVCIVGESGKGKSTLFELICNNLKPSKGEIKAQKLSCIYQDPYSSFHPSFSIINQIKDVIHDKEYFYKNINIFIKELNLSNELLEKKPHKLSGGQLQRCSILRSLLMNPKLLLVDEATSALDNVIALEVMKLLLKYLDKCAILLITHDMSLAKWCANKIIDLNRLYNGK